MKERALANKGFVTTLCACFRALRAAWLWASFAIDEKMSAPEAVISAGIFAIPRCTKSATVFSDAMAVSLIGPVRVRISAYASQLPSRRTVTSRTGTGC
jgi:hypothetical protein